MYDHAHDIIWQAYYTACNMLLTFPSDPRVSYRKGVFKETGYRGSNAPRFSNSRQILLCGSLHDVDFFFKLKQA
jgi:hypothetical protein